MAVPSDGKARWHVSDAAYASDTTASGMFYQGATGTNKTASTSVARTDLATGATATQVTSALVPFGSTDVGNTIWIPSGVTGFTSGTYRIVSVAGVTATLDTAPAAVSTTMSVGTVYLGGAIRSPGECASRIGAATDQVVDITGTHAITTNTANVSGGIVNTTSYSQWLGYNATIGDDAFSSTMLPVFTKANAVTGDRVFSMATGSAYRNLRFDLDTTQRPHTCPSNFVQISRSYIVCGYINDVAGCMYESCYIRVTTGSSGIAFNFTTASSVIRTTLRADTGTINGLPVAADSVLHRFNAGTLFPTTIAQARYYYKNCHLITTEGSILDASVSATLNKNFMFEDCILWNQDATSPDPVVKSDEFMNVFLRNCAYPTAAAPSNTNGASWWLNTGGVALAADPFTGVGSGNYTLTDTAKSLLRLTSAVMPGVPGFSQFGWIGAEPIAPAATSGGSKPALLGGAQYAY